MARRLKVNGKMGDGMGWVLRHVADGFIAANGPAGRKGAMVSGRVQHQRQSTKERGRADCRMDMARKRMLMEVG